VVGGRIRWQGHLLLGPGSTGPSRGVLMFVVVATAAAIAL
jgi:hypothetical protein